MKHLNRAMAVAVAATLAHHIETKVVEVELVPVTNQPQSMVTRARYVQHSKTTQLY